MSITRETFRHTAIYSLATVLGRLVSFIFLPVYAHMFRTEGYGVLGILDASLGLLTIPFAAGFHNAILKFYHDEEQDRSGIAITTALWMAWGLSSALVAIPLLFSSSISRFLLGDSTYSPHLRLALLTFVLDVGAQSASTYLVIRQKSVLYSVVGVLRLCVGIFLNVWLVVILQIGLIGFFVTSLVSAAMSLVIFLWPVVRVYGLRFDPTLGGRMLRFQLPLVPGDLVAYASRQADRFFVRFLESLESVGVLEMGYKFPPLLSLVVVQPFVRAWQTKYFEIADSEGASAEIGRMFTKYFFALAFCGLLLSINVENVIIVLTPPEFWPATKIARIDIVTTIAAGVNAYLALGLLYQKRTKRLGGIRFSAAPVKILLSFFFIYFLGIQGAAYSALIVEMGLVLWIGTSAQETYPVALEYRKLSVIAATAILMDRVLHGMTYEHYAFAGFLNRSFTATIAWVLSVFPEQAAARLQQLIASGEDRILASMLNTFISLFFLLLVPWISPYFAMTVLGRLMPRGLGRSRS